MTGSRSLSYSLLLLPAPFGGRVETQWWCLMSRRGRRDACCPSLWTHLGGRVQNHQVVGSDKWWRFLETPYVKTYLSWSDRPGCQRRWRGNHQAGAGWLVFLPPFLQTPPWTSSCCWRLSSCLWSPAGWWECGQLVERPPGMEPGSEPGTKWLQSLHVL